MLRRMEIPPAGRPPRAVAPGLAIAAAALLAYANSLGGPFVFDDVPSIVDNPALRSLWPPWPLLAPGAVPGLTTSGRPLVTASFALNFAFGGTAVWGYHAANLLIHVLAALLLYGLTRRTLEGLGREPPEAAALAFCAALLWAVHPLQTGAVTYVVQRAESLMALLFLLTLYAFARSAEPGLPPGCAARWKVLSVAACALGMAAKEVMAAAPVVVLLYDRTFLSGGFRAAWRRHRGTYVSLAATWLLLAALIASTDSRGGTAGFGTAVPWWRYALVQAPAVLRYLRLSLLPFPLVFDYGVDLAAPPAVIVPAFLAVASLLFVALLAFRSPEPGPRALGFAGLCFFAILAPTSSIVPVATQTAAEHRMYLPLAAVIAAAGCGLHALLSRVSKHPLRWCLACSLAAAAALGAATAARNADYRSALSLWDDTVAKRPGNADARYNLARLLAQQGRPGEAAAQYLEAVRLRPGFALAHDNLALVLARLGRGPEALAHAREAARLDPGSAPIRCNLGNLLLRSGGAPEAEACYREAIRLDPRFAEAHNDLAVVLSRTGEPAEALDCFREAVRLKPDFPEAYYNWGNALADSKVLDEACRRYEQAIRLRPDFPEAYFNWASALAEQGRPADAVGRLEEALRLKPDFPEARKALLLLRTRIARPGGDPGR